MFGDFIPFIKPGDLNSDGSLNYENEGLSNSGLSTARLIPPGAVLMVCIGATIGKCGFSERNIVTNQQINTIIPSAKVSNKFIYYQMLADRFQRQVILNSAQATLPIINKSKWGELTVAVLDSLPEQQRIVGILDKAFAGLAVAVANAEKNLQNAHALFESHLQAVFTQRGEGWEEKPLEAVASILNGYAFKSTDFSAKEGTKCIKITNVGVREFVPTSDGYLPESFAAEYEKVSVKEGNIVLALTRTIIAGGLKVAVVPEEYDGALLNQRVASIIANDKDLNGAFLFGYLSTQTVVDYVKERVNTLMQPNLSITDLRSMPIPAPPRREQNKITGQLDELREATQRLTSIYEKKLAALAELKKSLLHQAFRGEL